MTRTRFLTSSLATVAVAAAFTLAAPPANAVDAAQQCGQPAVTQAHPAITHTEWLWQRTQIEQASYTSTDYQRVAAEYSYTDYEWERYVPQSHVESQWRRLVPATQDQWHFEDGELITPAQEAVYETLYLYTNKPKTGGENGNEEKWYVEGEQPGGFIKVVPEETKQGDLITPATDAVYEQVKVVDVPGVPEHYDYSPFQTEAPEGDGWELADSRTVTDEPKHEVSTNQTGTTPAGDGWSLTSTTPHSDWFYVAPDTSVNAWAPTGNEADPEPFSTDSSGTPPTGPGWEQIGQHQVSAVTSTVTTPARSAQAPDSDYDWSKVERSAKTVTDKKAYTEIVTPATEPCPIEDGGVTAPVDREEVLGEGQPTPVAPQAAVATPHSVLPNTGNGASLGITLAGLGSLAAGAVLMMVSRRRRFGLD
jgi:LPXTG-motif cell wall-anchored protein